MMAQVLETQIRILEALEEYNVRNSEPKIQKNGWKKQKALHENSEALNYVLLPTAVVLVIDRKGKTHKCRALLEVVGTSNFMSTEMASILRIEQKTEKCIVNGLKRRGKYDQK